MINQRDKSRYTGTFMVAPDREVHGNLSLDGPNTSLYLWDEKFFHIGPSVEKTITGILDNRTKVSLLECVISGPGYYGLQDNISHYYNIFPHYVITGDQHISDTDEKIFNVYFLLDDATTLFHDHDAFGVVPDPHSIVTQIVESKNINRGISMGNPPWVGYYTGKREIFSSDTAIGRILALHSPSYSMAGGSGGVKIDNKIFVNLRFGEAITFGKVVYRMWQALRFFELIVGRAQNLVEFSVGTGTDQKPHIFDVYFSMYPKHRRSESGFGPDWRDILMDAVRGPDGFAGVLAAWLERDITWRGARERFFRSWEEHSNYDPNRLVSAANMFDLLPEADFPDPETPPKDLICAAEKAKGIFQSLPQSIDRDSVLGALGRVGKWKLKRKIRHRSRILLNKIEERLPELSVVTDEAVNCRNHYVHGSSSRIDYNEEPDARDFLTDTLEFVFAASDLVEAGWDIAAWHKTGAHIHHPFGRYLYSYLSELKQLKSLLPPSTRTGPFSVI